MPGTILLIEDNPDHALLIQAALESAGWPAPLSVISDGAQALEYVRWHGPAGGYGLPCLVVLDLKLPKVGGLEVLQLMRATPGWQQVPVVVLTTSNHPADRDACLAGGASLYLSKISALDGPMTDLVQAVAQTVAWTPTRTEGDPPARGPHQEAHVH